MRKLETYMGKDINDLTREELIEALNRTANLLEQSHESNVNVLNTFRRKHTNRPDF